MDPSTIPITETARNVLDALTTQTGLSAEVVMEKALYEYQRKLFVESVNAGYAALRADPEAWAEFQAELQLWDSTLMDGLDPNEHWSDDGRPLPPAANEA